MSPPPVLDDLSYFAGLLDGEGHIAVQKYARTKSGRPKTRFVMEIRMTDEGIIDWLLDQFGGNKRYHPSRNPRWKDQWRWRIQDRRARELYARVQHLLKIKGNVKPFTASKDGD